jgi:hypothetical protein
MIDKLKSAALTFIESFASSLGSILPGLLLLLWLFSRIELGDISAFEAFVIFANTMIYFEVLDS